MLDVKNCPDAFWYDITTAETGQKGMNTKVCLNLECKFIRKECRKEITSEGHPFYDPTGEKANSPPPVMIFDRT